MAIFPDFLTFYFNFFKFFKGVYCFSVDAEFYADSRALYENNRFIAKFDIRRVWKVDFRPKIHILGIFHEISFFVSAGEQIGDLPQEGLGIT